jgi:hypothetical protein
MDDKELEKRFEGVLANLVKIQSRCDACEWVLAYVAQQAGLDHSKITKLIGYVTDVAHQKNLEQTENIDPGLAGRIDFRTEFPDLPDLT